MGQLASTALAEGVHHYDIPYMRTQPLKLERVSGLVDVLEFCMRLLTYLQKVWLTPERTPTRVPQGTSECRVPGFLESGFLASPQ